ncbi:MAG: ice-binding family protein [Candidatus Dormiibacterota bacterium]
MRRSLLSVGLAALVVLIWPATAIAATLPPLGTAGNYAVLAGSTITNTGPSWITGKMGLHPGTSIVGFPPGTSGQRDKTNGAALQAKSDLTIAYNNAAGQTPATTLSGNLGNRTLVAGTYKFSSSAQLTGRLTLTGGGVFLFQIGSTLTTASASSVRLVNGAQPCDVFWQVGSSATIGTSTAMVGTIMANASITMTTGATLNGRALARIGAVTLDTNRIIQPSGCGYAAPTYVPPPSSNVLPATLGIPQELLGSFPWILVVGIGAGVGATALGVSARRRRRTT